jgi:uncharacterized membrane protein YccC
MDTATLLNYLLGTTVALVSGVVTWLVKREASLRHELREAYEQRNKDWKLQAEMHLKSELNAHQMIRAYEQLSGKKLSPPPPSS